jgi:hypothetical protein
LRRCSTSGDVLVAGGVESDFGLQRTVGHRRTLQPFYGRLADHRQLECCPRHRGSVAAKRPGARRWRLRYFQQHHYLPG